MEVCWQQRRGWQQFVIRARNIESRVPGYFNMHHAANMKHHITTSTPMKPIMVKSRSFP